MKHNQSTIHKIESICMNKPGVYESRPFGQYPICYRIMGKIFAQLNPEEKFYKISLKCNPEKAQLYRQLFPNIVVRGYHCPKVQQPYWNTVNLDLFMDMDMLRTMIDEAYEEVIVKLTNKAKKQFEMISKFEYRYTNGDNTDFTLLCTKLDLALDDLGDSLHDVIVVYAKDRPIGCGSFKMYDEDNAELKQIYIEPDFRCQGLGLEIVRRLESIAKIKGYRWCILETSEPLEAACHMYRKLGYKVIPNYGQYENMQESICMQRKI